MVSLTFILLPVMAFSRFRAVKQGKIKASQFKLMNLDEAPEFMKKIGRHWSNLYEVPTIFYALTLLCLFLNMQDRVFGILAWAYVVARFAHAIVHITYNRVTHRMFCFLVSNICLLVFFVRLIVNYQ